jgi:phosphoserine aminotransferase
MFKKKFFTPGPSELYPNVDKYIIEAIDLQIGSISHRSPQYVEIHKKLVDNLREIFQIPDNFTIFVGGSATQFMERVVENCVEKTSFHLVNGSFSRRFQEISRDLHKDSRQIRVGLGESFDFDNLKVPEESELITFTSCETSTGVEISPERIYQIKNQHPDKLIAVDAVSSYPYYNLNYKMVDAVIFSVQKGFGLPAGLGIAAVNERCVQKSYQLREKGISVGSYNAFCLIDEKAKNFQTLETPNVMGVYLLTRVLENMLAYGIEKIREETIHKANLLYNYFDNHSLFQPYISNSEDRSKTVIVIKYDHPKEVLDKFKPENIVIGGGYGEEKHRQFRIANFPAHSIEDMNNLLSKFTKFYG